MSKRFTESEVLAMTRNKKEEKALKLRLQKLTEQKGDYCDNSLKERKQLVTLCKDGQRTSGYSPVPSSTCFTNDVTVPTLQEMRRFTRPWAMTPLTTTFNINYQNTSPMPASSPIKRTKSSRERRAQTATSLMSSRISRNSSMVLRSFDTESSFENNGTSRFGDVADVVSARKEYRGGNMADFSTNNELKEENLIETRKKNEMAKEQQKMTNDTKDDALTSNDQNNNDSCVDEVICILTNDHRTSDPKCNTSTDSVENEDARGKADYVVTDSAEITADMYVDNALRIEKPNNVAKVKFRVEKQNLESEPGSELLSEKDDKVEHVSRQIWSRQKGNRFALTDEEIEELSEAFKKPKIFPKLSMHNTRPLNFHSPEKGGKSNENNRRSHQVRESTQSNVPKNESSTDEDQTLPSRLSHQSMQADDNGIVETANQRQSINQRPLTSIGESTIDKNVTQSSVFIHKPDEPDGHVRPHTVTGVETYADRELDFSSDSEGEEVIFHKGRKIRNYVKPQHRYKNDPFHFRRREKLIRKLATETEVYLDEQRKKLYNVEITFSKASRQRLLKQLVDENSSRKNKAQIDAKDDKLDSKIKSFLRSIDNFCNGNL